jgi:hypothetical protein
MADHEADVPLGADPHEDDEERGDFYELEAEEGTDEDDPAGEGGAGAMGPGAKPSS